jgi:hypothetical protein
MVDKLNDGTFFNLIFLLTASTSKPKLVRQAERRGRTISYLPIIPNMARAAAELFKDKRDGLPATLCAIHHAHASSGQKYVSGGHRNSQIDAPLGRIQMQADTIFIDDGAPIFERALFGKELEE